MSILAPIQPTESSAEKTPALNAADDAMACAALFGWNEIASSLLTWYFFGGTWPVEGVQTQIGSASITLAASSTNYIEADLMATSASAVVLVNQTGFTPGRVPLYTVVTGATAPSAGGITDVRPWVQPVESPFCGYQSIATTGGSTTLSQVQAAAKVLKFTGTLTSNASIVGPLVTGAWFVVNGCTGSYTLTLGGATGATVVVDEGARALVYCDGTGYYAITGNASGYGPAGAGATTTTAGFTIAAVGSTQSVALVNGVAFPTNGYCVLSDGTNAILGQVTAGGTTNSQTVKTVQLFAGAIGNTMASGATMAFSGPPAPIGAPNAQTGTSYTLALGDMPNGVTMNNASANTVTIPPNSAVPFPVGTMIPIAQLGAGQTSVAAGSGVTLNNASSNNCRTQYSTIGLWQIAANSWLVVGDTQ